MSRVQRGPWNITSSSAAGSSTLELVTRYTLLTADQGARPAHAAQHNGRLGRTFSSAGMCQGHWTVWTFPGVRCVVWWWYGGTPSLINSAFSAHTLGCFRNRGYIHVQEVNRKGW